MNIRSFVGVEDYFKINREERNLTAILYHLLLINDNLNIFLKNIDCSTKIDKDHFGIYFEYSYLRDAWKHLGNDNAKKKELICKFLNPSNRQELEKMEVEDFNNFFGAKSKHFIESPGNWRLTNLHEKIRDNNEFLKTCRFKWSFNVKPDIVINLSKDEAICIECKFETNRPTLYPSNTAESAIFGQRKLEKVSQTNVQQYMMEDLLCLQTRFVLLVNKNAKSDPHQALLWSKALKNFDLNSNSNKTNYWLADFFQGWMERLQK